MSINMKSYNFKIFAFLLLLSLVGCKKDIDTFTAYENFDYSKLQEVPNAGKNCVHEFVGEIIDENGKGIADVKVSASGKTTMTDKNGVFFLKNVTSKENHAYLTAEKAGYFKGSRVLIVRGNRSYGKIMLLKEQIAGKFASQDGATIKVGKASIIFPKNGYKNAQNQPYTGEVTVKAKYLDPSKNNTFLQMPGDLRAINTKGEVVGLGTYGMVVCDLYDNAGNKINLDGTSEATIRFPITSKFQAQTPTSMPLWSFDERLGTWTEEGSSTLEGNTFVGKVKHFSFWNCDYPFGVVKFDATIKDQTGNPIQGLQVVLCFNNSNDSLGINMGISYTDVNGQVIGLVPKNQQMTLKVFGQGCTVPFYTQTITTTNVDLSIPLITIAINAADIYIVKGKVEACAGSSGDRYFNYNALGSGLILLFGNALCNADGTFQFAIAKGACLNNNNPILLQHKGIDAETLTESSTATTTLVKGINDLGTINACAAGLDEYMEVEDNNKKYLLLSVNAYITGNFLTITAQGDSLTSGTKQSYFNLSFNPEPTVINTPIWTQVGADIFLDGDLFVVNGLVVPTTFTKIATKKDEYYEGTFNQGPNPVIGTDTQGATHVFRGKFRVKRKQ
jgi:hypothetical protein